MLKIIKKILHGIFWVGEIITRPCESIGTFLISEWGECVDAIGGLIVMVCVSGGFIYVWYPRGTKADAIASIVVGIVLGVFVCGISMFLLKIIRYLVSMICFPGMLLNGFFSKMELQTGRNPTLDEVMKKVNIVNLDEFLSKQSSNVKEETQQEDIWQQKQKAYEGYINQLRREKDEAEYKWKRMQAEQNARQTEQKANQRTNQRTESSSYTNTAYTAYQEALALYMLTEPFTKAELKKQRNRLLKSFHPDEGDSQTMVYAQKINKGYETLLQYAKN